MDGEGWRKSKTETATPLAPIMVICKFYPTAAYVLDNSSEISFMI